MCRLINYAREKKTVFFLLNTRLKCNFKGKILENCMLKLYKKNEFFKRSKIFIHTIIFFWMNRWLLAAVVVLVCAALPSNSSKYANDRTGYDPI